MCKMRSCKRGDEVLPRYYCRLSWNHSPTLIVLRRRSLAKATSLARSRFRSSSTAYVNAICVAKWCNTNNMKWSSMLRVVRDNGGTYGDGVQRGRGLLGLAVEARTPGVISKAAMGNGGPLV